MPIYTKTGDKGDTGLFSGKRISKASLRIEAIGTIDELSSVIGFTLSQLTTNNSRQRRGSPKAAQLTKELVKIQNDLFEIGAALANPTAKISLSKRVKEFEIMIDEMTKDLPALFNFILPGGGAAGSSLHIARTVCRRGERRIVVLSEKEKVQKDIIVYLNRLSDLFLTMARFINFKEKRREIIWKGSKD